jgi:hypothetical protein
MRWIGLALVVIMAVIATGYARSLDQIEQMDASVAMQQRGEPGGASVQH